MQLFISRGRTIAVYPCYRVELEKIAKKLSTGRLRVVGPWIFEIDFINGKPVCAISIDPKGNFFHGDKALLHLKEIYSKERDKYFLEIIQLSEKQISIDKEYAPYSIVKHPELLFEEKSLEELEKAMLRHDLEQYYSREMSVKEIRRLRFEELSVTELAQLIVRAKYVGKIKSSIRKIIERYRGIIYLSCIEDNRIVRIVIFDEVVKSTRPIDLNRDLQCKVFIIEENK